MQNDEPTATVLLDEQKYRIYEGWSWISPEQARRVSCDEPFPWLGVVNKSAVTIAEAEPRGLIGPVVFLARVSEFRYLQMASVWIDGERILSLPITEYIQSTANLQTQKEAFSFCWMPHSHVVLRQDVMLSWPSSPIHPSACPSTFVAWPDPVFCGVPNFGRCEGRKPRPSFGMLTLLAYPHEPWFDCALASRLMACWPELERVKNKHGNKTSHLVANG